MQHMKRQWITPVLLFSGLLMASGCKQDEGTRCQVNSDCASGLICCYPVSAPSFENVVEGATCAPANRCSTGLGDQGVADQSTTDGSVTAKDAVPTDAVATDAVATDAVATDAGSSDTSSADAGKADGVAADAAAKADTVVTADAARPDATPAADAAKADAVVTTDAATDTVRDGSADLPVSGE